MAQKERDYWTIRMDADTHHRLKVLAVKHKVRIGMMIRRMVIDAEKKGARSGNR